MTPASIRIRRHRRRTAPLAVSLLLVAGLALACGGGSAPTSTASGPTITVYNAQHEQTTSAMIAAFTKQTGIRVRVDNDDEDVLTAKIEQEGNRSPADVIYTENSNWLQQLDDHSLLTKVDAATLANVPQADNATNGDWVGVSGRMSVMVYNPSKLDPAQLPKSVLDLADPQWKDKIEISPSETDFWPIVSAVSRAKGQAAAVTWLKALKDNAGTADNVPDSETLTSDVSQGITDLAIINHYYFYRLQAEVGQDSVNAKIAYFAPRDPGYVEDISGAAIVKSSTHQAAAQQLLAFMTSQAGQRVLAQSESFEYPLSTGVAANSELTPLSQLQPTSFTPAQLGAGLDAKTLLQQAGLI